jgi:hypothetical protein
MLEWLVLYARAIFVIVFIISLVIAFYKNT